MEQARPSSEGRGRIVVGVDGSAPSKAALHWAVRQARLTGAAVEALTAWEYPVTYGCRAPVLATTDFEDTAARILCDSIAEVAAPGEAVTVTTQELVITGPDEPVPVISRLVGGGAARALLEASAGAVLLVVGSRGHGGFAGALLGSVSQHCVMQASCPVVVVRDSPAGREGHGKG